MDRKQIKQHNRKVIMRVTDLIKHKLTLPYYCRVRMGYKELAANLNKFELLSSRGNEWTFRSLYRMMQRQNIAIHTIKRALNKKGIKRHFRNGHIQPP